MVANGERHSLPGILLVESLIHPFECICLACPPTLIPKHGMRFPVTALIVVLTALVFKYKPELIWGWFKFCQFLIEHGGLAGRVPKCLALLFDGKFTLEFRDKAGVMRTDQRQRMAKSGFVLG